MRAPAQIGEDQMLPFRRQRLGGLAQSHSPAGRPASAAAEIEEIDLRACARASCDTRASVLRPVSALMRLDLPALERPTKAIFRQIALRRQAVGVAVPADEIARPGEQLARDSSFSRAFTRFGRVSRFTNAGSFRFSNRCTFTPCRRMITYCCVTREQIVPGVIDHQPRRERREHEGEDQRHEGEHLAPAPDRRARDSAWSAPIG